MRNEEMEKERQIWQLTICSHADAAWSKGEFMPISPQ